MADSVFQKLHLTPSIGFLRLNQIIGDANTPAIIPVKKTCWWAGVKSGRFPKGIKLGRMRMWRVQDILDLVEDINRRGKI